MSRESRPLAGPDERAGDAGRRGRAFVGARETAVSAGGGGEPSREILILSGSLVLRLGRAANASGAGVSTGLVAAERVLVSLVDGRRPLRELARLSGLPPAAAHDHLRALLERGVVEAIDEPAPASATPALDEPRRITRERGGGSTSTPSARVTVGTSGAVRAEPPPAPPARLGAAIPDLGGQRPSAPLHDERASSPPPVDGRAVMPVRVGPYEVATRIGQGGMASIYICRRAGGAGFQRYFALKVVRERSGQEEAAVRSFLGEARVGGLLAHPNLQSVVDTGTCEDQPFLVLDYIEGASLSELVADGRRLPAPVTVSIVLDVLRGLQAAHDTVDAHGRHLGLVHADVSPPNILVGLDGRARLCDFGSARFTILGEPGAPEALVTGKPGYMAPESLLGEPIDARADIFSLGVVLWSALTGEDLFTGASHELTVHNVLRKWIAPPSAHGAPACLDDICLRALSRSLQDRYFTAEEMATSLLRVAVAADLVAPPRQVGQLVRAQRGDVLAERRRRTLEVFGAAAPRTAPARDDAPLGPTTAFVAPESTAAPPPAPASGPPETPPSPAQPPRASARLLRLPIVVSAALGVLAGVAAAGVAYYFYRLHEPRALSFQPSRPEAAPPRPGPSPTEIAPAR